MKIDPNMPAFPRAAFASADVKYEDCGIHDSQEGMTIRAEFAKAAMQGMLANGGATCDEAVAMAVRLADRLIEELNRE